jgi:hypothetical protein
VGGSKHARTHTPLTGASIVHLASLVTSRRRRLVFWASFADGDHGVLADVSALTTGVAERVGLQARRLSSLALARPRAFRSFSHPPAP